MNTEKVLINAKTLRTKQREAEQRLWYHLRAHRFMALKFKRQKPMGRFIVDFVCVEHRLIIEIDGVLEQIRKTIALSPSPSPTSGRGE